MSPAKKKKQDVSAKPPTPTRYPAVRAVPESQAIASRAYELFVQRGGQHGHDWEDWFNAQRQLVQGDR
jgi:hypothetical protein